MVRVERVSKTFGRRAALRELSFEVAAGEMFGILGPNGAGKSTTFGLLLGHIAPTSGRVLVDGAPVGGRRRAAPRIGVVPEGPAFPGYLTGRENLRLLASHSPGVAAGEIDDAIRFVGLASRIDDRVETYSRGMRQRLAIAQALIPAPNLLLLDEPAEGLDPNGIADMRLVIQRLHRERGLTVLIASHLLAEVEEICERVLVLVEGRAAFVGAWRDDGGDSRRVRLALDDPARAAPVLARFATSVERTELTLDGTEIALAANVRVADLVSALVGAGVRVSRVEPVRRTLADVYRAAVASTAGTGG